MNSPADPTLLRRISPLKLLLLGYASYIAIGWTLLCTPWCQSQTDSPAIDHLFTAVSAVSTTGLATIGTPDSYSVAGQAVILLMIQLGGIGYMTIGSFVLLARHRELSNERTEVAKLSFALPEGFSISTFLRNVVIFTVAIESVGAAALYFAFRSAGVADPGWQATFHSVSAFCTAGFSLFDDGLVRFADNAWVQIIIATLSLSGAIGFLVMSDVFASLTGKKKQKTLTSRIILRATFFTLLGGWALLFLIEPTLRDLPPDERLMRSGFQTMTALTTVGFNTVDFADFATGSTFLILLLMILGASPSGTGGGLKSTSVSAAIATVWCTLHGRQEITFGGCRVPPHRLTAAFAAVVFYVGLFFVGGLLMLLVQPQEMQIVLFETASALGTVGISQGLTGELTPLGKLIVIALMFIGRVGPITFGLALFADAEPLLAVDDLAV